MALTNKWTNPLRRSFQDIREDLLNGLTSISDPSDKNGKTPLITDISEGNILVMILSLVAAVAEVIHYYIDNMVRESFITTARRYSSVSKLGALVDYHNQGANAPTVDVILTREQPEGGVSKDITLKEGTSFKDSKGNSWLLPQDVIWSSELINKKVTVVQHQLVTATTLNNTKLIDTSSVIIPYEGNGWYYEKGTMSFYIKSGENDEPWFLVDTFAYSKKDDRHFRVEVDESGIIQAIFGDGKFGRQPDQGSTIHDVLFYVTKGTEGNIYANELNTIPEGYPQIVACNNPYDSGDGSSYDDLDRLKRNIPLQARTMGVAITKQDFIDLAKSYDGVGDVAMDYVCGKKMILYISPIYGGIASEKEGGLCDNLKKYVTSHAPMNVWVDVKPAGRSRIVLDIEVTGRPSALKDNISKSINEALSNTFPTSGSQIGGSVRISDIYALIDNLPLVDYLYIKKFFVSPWPKIIYGNKQLNLTISTIDMASGSMTYIISFKGDNKYQVYAVSGGYISDTYSISNDNAPVNIQDYYNKFKFSFIIEGSYPSGSKYSFTISEPNHDYEEPGFNTIYMDEKSLSLTIHETV